MRCEVKCLAATTVCRPQQVLSFLSEREARVIKLRFGLMGSGEMTLEEIGERFNVTRERVRQVSTSRLAVGRGQRGPGVLNS